jgi:Methylamine utilisation protein MauE
MQAILIAVVLLWSAQAKLRKPQTGRTALSRFTSHPVAAYRVLGGIEAVVGLALFWPSRVPAAAASLLCAGFLAFLLYAQRTEPEASCGCLGAQSVPITMRSVYRAGLLLLVSLSAVFFPVPFSAWGVIAVAAGLAAVVALSPELDRHWLIPWRRTWARWTHPLSAPGAFDIPLESTVEQLHHSPVFRELAGDLTSDVREHWDADEWRILVYTIRSSERIGSAVFAVPRLRYAPDAVRATVVDLL